MPSDQPSASTVATDPAHTPHFSPRRRWKKPSSGPQPRTGGANQRGPNPSPLGPPSSRSELKRTLRESAETAGLVLDLNAAKASSGSDASVRPDGDNGDLKRLGPVRVALDADHGAARSLWSDADEVKLLAAAAAFRERTGRPPLHLDAGALFDSIRGSVSPHIDEAMAYDKLMRFESKFLCGALGSSAATHDRRVHDLSTRVWGALDVVPLPEDDSEGQGTDESYSDERRLITERAPLPAPSPCLNAPVPSERSSASSIDAGGAPTLPSHDERCLITEGAPMPALSPRLDAPSPSERSSASSMNADATPTPPCPDERRLITERAPMPALSPRLDAPSPSERSSASFMDADTAPTPPCPDEQRLITERAPMPALSPRIDAPTPSERSSPFSMDANAAPTPPSPPSSKKRSLSPLLSMGDGHQDPNSSPCGSPSRRLRISAESTVVALAAAAAAAATRWSDVEGGHEDVQGLESAGVAVDLGRGTVQGLQPSGDGCHGVAPNYPKIWSDADEVTLLAAAAAFRERTGRSPLRIDAGALFDSIRDSVSPRINEANVSYKLTRFRSQFLHSAPGESATAHDRLLHDLSAKAWGSVNTVAREARDAATKTPVVTEGLEGRDAATKMPVVSEVLDEYWKMNGQSLAGLSLEKGLSLLWKKNGRLIETRWRKQIDGEMQTQMRGHDLAKEICGLLNDTIKGLGT